MSQANSLRLRRRLLILSDASAAAHQVQAFVQLAVHDTSRKQEKAEESRRKQKKAEENRRKLKEPDAAVQEAVEVNAPAKEHSVAAAVRTHSLIAAAAAWCLGQSRRMKLILFALQSLGAKGAEATQLL